MTEQSASPYSRSTSPVDFDVLIVGAGFAGLFMLYRLRGRGLSARVFEAGGDVGGTWNWNRYPGARCDVESLDYSYSFNEPLEQEWHWTERYAAQPEILRYASHVADRFDLRRDIQFDTRVTAAHFDEAAHRWRIVTEGGESVTARFCVMATGCLSVPQPPSFAGLETFRGEWYQTGRWPHQEIDFHGKKVGVIGTGSSAIQSIPVVAQHAAAVTVFQRTANYSVPAHNAPLDPRTEQRIKAEYPAYRQRLRESRVGYIVPANPGSALDASPDERRSAFEERWQRGGLGFGQTYADLLTNPAANATAVSYFHDKIRALVHDPETAALLCPTGFPLGTKRICVDTDYYDTFNHDHVSLVDLQREPIVAVTATGLRTAARDYECDRLVFATGFDAMTGALNRIDIRGRGGVSLRETWHAGPRSYLGLMVAGFPNLFTITGPGSPSVLSNMMVSIEQHVDWIADCLDHLHAGGFGVIEASPAAQEAWVTHGNEVASGTLFPLAKSWYTGANIAGKPRVFMPYVGGVGAYRVKCDEIAAKGYAGFNLGG